jgi:hypothetical protein
MYGTHHSALFAGYGAAMIGWLLLSRRLPWLQRKSRIEFEHPGGELAWALLAVVGVIGLGMAYSAGIRFPKSGSAAPLLEALNQVLIFSPFWLLLLIRHQPLETAWIRTDHLPGRIAIGAVLACLAVLAFSLVRRGSDPFPSIIPRLLQPSNIQYAAQVFFEDFAIAILMVRLAAFVRRKWLAAALVAALFAAGHVPALLSDGVSSSELTMLVLDFGLVLGLLWIAQRGADIWWLFVVHFSMDMMQFKFVSGVDYAFGIAREWWIA